MALPPSGLLSPQHLLLLARRGGVLDIPWGFVAGSFAGLAVSATFACLFLAIDAVPLALWGLLMGTGGGNPPWGHGGGGSGSGARCETR